jgi:glycosyltransferase involved in cell wall biosynthesis
MERASAFIVPLRIGGGTRLKIYEAMAMEKPVISTSIGAEGLPLRDGCELLIADTPGEFAEKVVRVISNEALANEFGRRAASTVREHFGWQPVAETFADICREAIERSRFRRTATETAEALRTAV